MYSDDNQRKGMGLISFLIKFLIVAVFIGLILWLYPFPKQFELPNLKTFYDDVFNRNVQTMRDAAVNYYTVDKLPKEDNQTYKLTLQDMLDKKLILPFTDKNGEACDTYGSYVSVTKIPEKLEYKFKINLSCPASGQEDYILEYRGCYDLCTNNCTTPQITKPIKVVKRITYPKEPAKPSPRVTARVNSCAVTNDEFGSAVITVARASSDANFNYVIKVRQPGAWLYRTVKAGTITRGNPSDSVTVLGTRAGTLAYQVYINNKLYKTGSLNLDECQEPVEPRPIATAGVNSCLVTGNDYSSIVMSISRTETDPSFSYSMRVRQPGAWLYNTVASGTITASNPSITRTVIGTGAGSMEYQIFINGDLYRAGNVNIEYCPEVTPTYEYLHRRDTEYQYWTAYSNWSLTPVTATATRKVQTIDYYRGYKWIPNYTYEFQQKREVDAGYSAWSAWSGWSTTSRVASATMDVESRTVTTRVATGTKTVYGSWYYARKERRTTMYTSIYNTGSAATATEYRQFLGTVTVRDCTSCGIKIYYEYSIYTRSKTTTTLYDYVTHREYRYRTRSAITKTEYTWTNSRIVSGWTYTGYYRITNDNGYYAESGWLMLSDWNTLLADGYTFYQKRTYYTYSDLVTGITTEYKWTRNISEPGWVYTGTYREV